MRRDDDDLRLYERQLEEPEEQDDDAEADDPGAEAGTE